MVDSFSKMAAKVNILEALGKLSAALIAGGAITTEAGTILELTLKLLHNLSLEGLKDKLRAIEGLNL